MAEAGTENGQMEVGFAVVGLGMGQHHVGAIRKVPGAKLVAVCDVREDRLKTVSERAGCLAYDSYDRLLENPEVQVVNICTPSGTHADFVVKAAAAGKNILCEKPLDVRLESIDRMLAAAKQHGVKLAGIFQRRMSGVNQSARQAVRDGRLGRLAIVDVSVRWWRTQGYYNADGGWRGTWALDGGGAVMNQGVHSVDMLQFIGGPVKSVYAKTAHLTHDIETEDTAVALLTFESGAFGTITATTSAYPGLHEDVHVHGDRGSIVIVDGQLRSWRIKQDNDPDHALEKAEEAEMIERFGPRPSGSGASDPMAISLDGHGEQIADMVAAIRENRGVAVPGEEARHAVELITALYRSAQEGREVALAELRQ